MLAYIDYYLFTAPIPRPSDARYRIIVGYMIKQLNIWKLANYRQDIRMIRHLYPAYKDDPLVIYERNVINADSILELLPQYPPDNADKLIEYIMNISYSLSHYNLVKLLQPYATTQIRSTHGYYSLSQTVPDKRALDFAARFHNLDEIKYCLSHNIKHSDFVFSIGKWLLSSPYNEEELKLIYRYFYGSSRTIASLLITGGCGDVSHNDDAGRLLLMRRHNMEPPNNRIMSFENLVGLMTMMDVTDEEILYVLGYSERHYVLNIEAPSHIKHRIQVLGVGAGLLSTSVMDDCDMCQRYRAMWDHGIKLC